MDYNLLKSFRVFYQDYVLLYDAIQIYHKIRPTNKTIKEFTSGIATLVDLESSIDNFPPNNLANKKDSQSNNQYSAVGLIWEVINGVFLEFIVDEISQYPFWVIKVNTVSFPIENGSIVTTVYNEAINRYRNGGLYRGLYPYIIASMIQNYSVLEKSLKSLFVAICHKLPKLPSRDMIKRSSSSNIDTNSFESSSSSLLRKKGEGNFKKFRESSLSLNTMSSGIDSPPRFSNKISPSSNSSNFKKSSKNKSSSSSKTNSSSAQPHPTQPPAYDPMVAFIHGAAAAIAHPFFVLSVRMASDTDYSDSTIEYRENNQNNNNLFNSIIPSFKFSDLNLNSFIFTSWIQPCLNIISKEGFKSLYVGVRSSVSAAVLYNTLPISMTSLFGIYETLILRRVLSAPGCFFANKIYSGTSFSLILRSMLSREGYSSLFRYGIMSSIQIVPGFASFIISRYALWIIFGSTQQRIQQKRIRDQILTSYWSRK